MICDECKKNQASVFYKTNVNGVIQQKNLCGECASKYGGQNFHNPFSFADILNSWLEGGVTPMRSSSGLHCSSCGMTPARYRQLGRLGCAQCYTDLRELLMPIIQNIHGRTAHAEQAPALAQTAKAEPRTQEHDQADALKRQMDEAVAVEDFEKAAQLRDRLRALVQKEEAQL